jgi:hypothetical protein
MRGQFNLKSLQQAICALALVSVFGVSSALGGAGSVAAGFEPTAVQQAAAAALTTETGLKIEALSYSP